jgi:DNA-binding IclR family transcriptional regulator
MRLPSQARTIDRVRGEFREMRGFSPTLDQAARLFDLPRDECDRVLRSLVSDGSLRKCEDGRYRLI